MKKHIIIFFLFPLWGLGGFYAQTVQWVKRGGSNENLGNDYESVYSIATDSQKNYYVLSYVGMSDLDVDGNPKSNYDSTLSPQDVVLASFSCDGTYRWSKIFGGLSDENINSVVVDSQDNVYVGGKMQSCHPYPGTPGQPYPARIDSDYFFNNSDSACSTLFIAKFNSNGVLQYVKKPQQPTSSLNNVSNTGSFGFEMHNDIIYWYMWLPPGTYADGGFTNSNTADTNTPYVLQYNVDGTFISATQLGTLQTYASFKVKYYRNPHNGYHYATIRKGDSSSTFSINGQPVVNSVALVCYDNNGTFLWKRENTYSDANASTLHLNDLSFDAQNNIFIAGDIFGLNYDSFLGFSDSEFGTAFLMKTNPTATSYIWVSYPSTKNIESTAIYNNGSEIAIAGSVGGGPTLAWGSQTLTVPGANQGTDVLLARINSATGACVSLNKIASNNASLDFGAAITKDLSGDYIVGGRFGGALYNVNNTGGFKYLTQHR